MRIGYLCHAALFAACGPGSRTAGLVAGLRSLGHEVHVRTRTLPPNLDATRHEPDEQGLHEMARQVDVCLVRLDGGCHAERLAEQMLEARPNLPIVLEIHSPLEEQREYRASFPHDKAVRDAWVERGNRIRRRLGQHGAAVGVSEGMARYASRQLGARRTLAVPNAADTDRFAPCWPRPQPFLILWAGSPLYPWQAVDVAIEAARLAPDLQFLLACSQAEGLPADLPSNVRAEIAVPAKRMEQLYAKAHAALVLYRPVPNSRWGFYGSPLKLYEALAAGTPVVGSELGEIPHVIRRSKCGFVVNNEPGEVVASLRQLHADSGLAERLGRAAREAAQGRTWRDVAREIADFCASLLAQRSLKPPPARTAPGETAVTGETDYLPRGAS